MTLNESEQTYNQTLAVLGGGTGQFNLLRGLVKLNNPESITAIPGTGDSNGSSGRLRTELGVLPYGDARRCLIALMEDEEQLKEALRISDDRFKNVAGPLQGHDFLNLTLDLLSRIHQGGDRAMDGFRRLYRIRGHVLPSSLELMDVITKRKSGKTHYTEGELDDWPNDTHYNPNDQIVRILSNPPRPEANPEAVKAIKNADKIIFSSGSLFGSILPHLLINEIREAILGSDAPLILIQNIMTEKGQTDYLSASQHLRHFVDLMGNKDRLTHMIVPDNHLDADILELYRTEGQEPVRIDSEDCLKICPNLNIVRPNSEVPLVSYLKLEHLLRHNPLVLAKTILEL